MDTRRLGYNLWEASSGPISRQAATEAAAQEKLAEAVRLQIKNMYKQEFVFSPSGKTVYLVHYVDGWCIEKMSGAMRAPMITRHLGESFEAHCIYAVDDASAMAIPSKRTAFVQWVVGQLRRIAPKRRGSTDD